METLTNRELVSNLDQAIQIVEDNLDATSERYAATTFADESDAISAMAQSLEIALRALRAALDDTVAYLDTQV